MRLDDLLNGNVKKQKITDVEVSYCILLTQKLCTKVPLDFDHDLDVLIRRDLKP